MEWAGHADAAVWPDRGSTRESLWERLSGERDRIVRLLSARGVAPADAEDYAQEAILRVASSPRVHETNLSGLLSVVAMRLVCDGYRAQRRHERIHRKLHDLEVAGVCPIEVATVRQEVESLLRTADSLPSREREVFMLWAGDIGLREIAVVLRISYKSAESALARARVKLRGQLLFAEEAPEQSESNHV